MSKTYTVIAPLVIAKDDTGSQRYCPQGTPMPGNILPTELLRLRDMGMITEDAPPELRAGAVGVDASATVSGQVEFPAAADLPVVLTSAAGTGPVEMADPPEVPQRPQSGASKAAWVAYAVSVRPDGQSEDDARTEAEKYTAAQLAARYPAAPAV